MSEPRAGATGESHQRRKRKLAKRGAMGVKPLSKIPLLRKARGRMESTVRPKPGCRNMLYIKAFGRQTALAGMHGPIMYNLVDTRCSAFVLKAILDVNVHPCVVGRTVSRDRFTLPTFRVSPSQVYEAVVGPLRLNSC